MLKIYDFHEGQLPIYAHLLPLVDYLVAHGMAPDPEGFRPTPGGWDYYAASPIPFDALDAGVDLPPSMFANPANDIIFDAVPGPPSWAPTTRPPVAVGHSSDE